MYIPEHFNFAHLPTPVRPLDKFFKQAEYPQIWLKRDDLTGLELSGNKVRKLDFLLKDAASHGAERVITCGGLQSNHCRATAFYAAQLGMKATLVLRGQAPDIPDGNYFLNKLLGADIFFVTPEEYKEADELMKKIAAEAKEKTYVIPEGGSNEIGAWGYVNAFLEIAQQGKFDAIVCATGSGGTHSGLLLGKLLTKSPVQIFSVNVCDDAPFFKAKIGRIMQRFCRRYGFNLQWTADDINIIDGFVGEGYALITEKEARLIRSFARSEGLLIDPVYGAKAMLGFKEQLKKGAVPGEKLLFIHTGGAFGLFPFREILLKE